MDVFDLIVAISNGAFFVQFLLAAVLGLGSGFFVTFLGFDRVAPFVAGGVFIASFSALLLRTLVRSKKMSAGTGSASHKIAE